jgi:hypothetical protein
MRYRWIWMPVMLAVLAAPAAAEFYRYRDKSGTIHFTDNLAEVPPAQRGNLKTYREAPPTRPGTTTPDATATDPEPAAAELEPETGQGPAETDAERLRQRQNALIQEYEVLQKEREALAQRGGQRVNNAQQARYTEAVEALNAKIRGYQQRREAYERDVQAHNARMARQAAPGTAPAAEP